MSGEKYDSSFLSVEVPVCVCVCTHIIVDVYLDFVDVYFILFSCM